MLSEDESKMSESETLNYSEVREWECEAGTIKYRIVSAKVGPPLPMVSAEEVQTLKNGTFKEGEQVKVWSKEGTVREGRMSHFVIHGYKEPYSFYPMVQFPRNKRLVRVDGEHMFPATMSDEEITAKYPAEMIVKREVNQYSEDEIKRGIAHILRVFKSEGLGWGVRMQDMTRYSKDDRERLMRQAALRRMIKDGLVVKAGRDRYNLTKAGQKKAKEQEQ